MSWSGGRSSTTSLVIPTLGRPILEACLTHIATAAAWPQCLIVVEQGNNPVVAQWLGMLSRLGLASCYVPSTQRGRSAGINRGLERVQTRFVAITDDDCFVSTSWLAKMDARLRGEPGTIVTGRVELAGNEEVTFPTVTANEMKIYRRPTLKAHPFIGGNVGLAMALVERIGLFDEHPTLASAEDSDYGYRALRLGIPILYDPDIVLDHYHWRDAAQRETRYRQYSRSQGGFYGKHLLGGDWLIPLQAARALARGPLRWARGLIQGDQDMVARGRADALELLPGLIAGMRRGRER
jgi:GT2 family glycosyltransferase